MVRGDMLMKGYWRDPATTASVIKDGWLYTGDPVATMRMVTSQLPVGKKTLLSILVAKILPLDGSKPCWLLNQKLNK